jgi:hypothetical protein
MMIIPIITVYDFLQSALYVCVWLPLQGSDPV